MKKDDITTLKIPSPDPGTELEVATISFADITHCTTALLNASIEKAMITDETRHIALSFVDVSADIQTR
jgi:hypothetical protein